MKKLLFMIMAICLFLPLASATALTAHAASDVTVILFEGVEQNDNTVKIDVNVRENSGVYSMLLVLEYDTSALTLDDIEYGSAFSSLDPLPSGDYSTVPYKISYLGKDNKNDTSTGKMMTLTFTVKENAPDGEYTVTFGYDKDKDVPFLKDGEIQTKNLVIEGVKITIKDSEIEKVEVDGNPEETNKNNAIGWIIAGAVVGAGLIATVIILLAKKKKHKWVKV